MSRVASFALITLMTLVGGCHARHDKVVIVRPEPQPATKVRVLVFTASWCGPCQKFHRELDKVQGLRVGSNQLELVLVDVDKDKACASKYGIKSVPTFCVLDGEKCVRRKSGYTSSGELIQWFCEGK